MEFLSYVFKLEFLSYVLCLSFLCLSYVFKDRKNMWIANQTDRWRNLLGANIRIFVCLGVCTLIPENSRYTSPSQHLPVVTKRQNHPSFSLSSLGTVVKFHIKIC